MRHIALVIVSIAATTLCQAKTIYIDANGTGDYPTIQAAINGAINGDVIILLPGTYTGLGNRNIDCNGRSITIQSTDPCDPAIVASTVIDCQRNGRAFKFVKGETSLLAGLTIINGLFSPSPNNEGGDAIFCNNSNLIILNCVINKCGFGGPLYSYSSSIRYKKSKVKLTGCTVTNILSYYSIGIYCSDSNTEFTGCTITGNMEGIHGYFSNAEITGCVINNNHSGIFLEGYSLSWGYPSDIVNTARITDSIITGNASGIYCGHINLTVERSTISDNIAADSYQGASGIYALYSNMVINDCLISRNKSFVTSALYYGGGVTNDLGSLVMNGCDVNDNKSIYGGGISNHQGTALIKNCRITNNTAGVSGNPGKGGGIYYTMGNQLIIEGCTINGNKTYTSPSSMSGYGGGIDIDDYTSPAIIKNSVITGNKSKFGGGIYAGMLTDVNNCVIANNQAQQGGGAYRGGAFVNCTFKGNKAETAGGIYGGSYVSNCIFWDDIIAGQSQSQWVELSNEGNVTYSNVRGGFPGEGNINIDPGFTFENDFHLLPDSPCIDAGTDTLALPWSMPDELPAYDLDGNPRVIDGDSDGLAKVDMGAYEFNPSISRLAISASQFNFSCAKDGPNPEPQVFQIQDCNGGILNWEIIENCPWLNISPQSGTSVGKFSEATITVDANLLEPGTYLADIQVIASNAAGSHQTVSVILNVGRLIQVPQDFNTIQSAINDANNFDWVLVADGVYTGPGNYDIDLMGKSINVRSQNGPETCIIDCNGTPDSPHIGFIFYSPQPGNSILDGFTITNGYGGPGGAIWIYYTSPTIKNCVFQKNTADEGGALFVRSFLYMPTVIKNCSFTENSAEDYGGAISGAGLLNIDNCSFINNSSIYGSGGGIVLNYDAVAMITGCNFTGNYARHGGAIAGNGSPLITNSSIVGNTAGFDGGAILSNGRNAILSNSVVAGNRAVHEGAISFRLPSQLINCTVTGNISTLGGSLRFTPSTIIKNCILNDDVNNQGSGLLSSIVSFSNVRGGCAGQGNIDEDPCFVLPGHWDPNGSPDDTNDDFWVNGDYYLKTESLCIDAGDPNYKGGADETDFDGNQRIAAGRIDMGAYEYQPPVEVQVDITPNTLNLKSKGQWISCLITLPEGYNVADIDTQSILLEDQIQPKQIEPNEAARQMSVKFDRGQVQSELRPGRIELIITGQFKDGTAFEGGCIISVINPGKAPKIIQKPVSKQAQ